MPTNYTYTGQYSYTQDFGLMFYNARWLRSVPVGYDPSLGRFAQADSIVPPGVQGLDRYAYVNNSPMNYVDPSGHDPWWDDPYFYYADIQKEINNGNTDIEQAFNGLNNLGAFGESQKAWELGVLTEYGTEGLNSIENTNYQALDEAIVRRYAEYCDGGDWTTTCVQSFWGYMQFVTDSRTPDDAKNTQQKADAKKAGLGNPDAINIKIHNLTNPSQRSWREGCLNGNALCDWAAMDASQSYYNNVLAVGPKYLYGTNINVIWPNGMGWPAIVVISPNELQQLCSENGVPSNNCSLPNFP